MDLPPYIAAAAAEPQVYGLALLPSRQGDSLWLVLVTVLLLLVCGETWQHAAASFPVLLPRCCRTTSEQRECSFLPSHAAHTYMAGMLLPTLACSPHMYGYDMYSTKAFSHKYMLSTTCTAATYAAGRFLHMYGPHTCMATS